MNSIPLPDELLRKVMGYLLPIFEYAEYIHNIKSYNDTQLDMTLICHDCQDMLYEGSPSRKLSILSELIEIGKLQQKHLVVIDKFLKQNPRCSRPDTNDQLNENQYKRAFDYQITERNMQRFAENTMLRRGMWEFPDTKKEILLYTDMVHLLYEGSIKDLLYACIINNVGDFRKEMENHYHKDIKKIWDFEIICFINDTYSNIDYYSLRWWHFRRDMVSSLMKI